MAPLGNLLECSFGLSTGEEAGEYFFLGLTSLLKDCSEGVDFLWPQACISGRVVVWSRQTSQAESSRQSARERALTLLKPVYQATCESSWRLQQAAEPKEGLRGCSTGVKDAPYTSTPGKILLNKIGLLTILYHLLLALIFEML